MHDWFTYHQEPTLRATQYLPEIVQLQQQMYSVFHRKLDQKEANQLTVRGFIKYMYLGKGKYIYHV